MQNQSEVSLAVSNQLPDFIREEFPRFEKFLSSYYASVERGSGAVGILNNLPEYFDVSKYDLKKLSSRTRLIADISSSQENIQVESVDSFPDENGSILINDEVIYYESIRKSPAVVTTPDISYSEFQKKQILLANIFPQLDGVRNEFPLISNQEPVFPQSPHHLIVKLYNQYLRPGVDFIVLGDKIRFTQTPRKFDPTVFGDGSSDISFSFMKGFMESTITPFDSIPIINTDVDPIRYDFKLKVNNVPFIPSSLSLIVAIVDGKLLVPNVDYTIYQDTIIFKDYPRTSCYVSIINAPLLSVGSGVKAYSVVNNAKQVESIKVLSGGSGYTLDNAPFVSLVKGGGTLATAKALVDGVKSITLLNSGLGYSQVNPPRVVIQPPTAVGGIAARAVATVDSTGHVDTLTVEYSGAGYDAVPRIRFVNPSGAKVGNVVLNPNGSVASVSVLSAGTGYTVAPEIFIERPPSLIGIRCLLQGNLNAEGGLESVTVLTGGTQYDVANPPRSAVIQPTGAQVLGVEVDGFGRVVNIELLSGGFGYEDVPSIYIVDGRVNEQGLPIGGTGATAAATIFNGEIIDISITNFGDNYSVSEPPQIFIASPSEAKASCEIGDSEITGFEIIEPGKDYVKTEFLGCSRGVSGVIGYDAEENAIFKPESESIASSHSIGSVVTGLDSLFLRKILDRLVRQFVPGIPILDLENINISNVLRTVKDFYASKGTEQSVSYLFKILYGVDISISYPKDQIIKPSAASWEVDTVLRTRLISGNPQNILDTVLVQQADPVDSKVKYAEANVENFIAIQTSDYDVYELVVSEESLIGEFVVPYATKLAEPVVPSDSIITVDSTIGWPERNGEFIIGTELVRYKEKSLTQFIECTRGQNEPAGSWDSATIVTSNFYIRANAGTANEVVMSVLGIVESNNTKLIDQSSYYLPGDKLNVSRLGSLDDTPLVTSWLYNVKKLIQVQSITFGGLNNKTATVTCDNPHGLLVGDKVTVYGANPIVYNGTFLISARESSTIFKYELPQPANQNPQGSILISVDLNKGKSDTPSIDGAISNFATNIQNTFFDSQHVYVAASGIPNYKVGPFLGTSLLPGNQRKLYRFPRIPQTISLKPDTTYGSIGSFVNGVSAWNFKSDLYQKFGPVTKVNITNAGSDYDASSPPRLSFIGGGGSGAEANVIVNGSIVEIDVINQGTGYETAPLVSISGGGGSGASATAILTNEKVTRILMNSGGSGFTSSPTIVITGGNGTGCTAIAKTRGPIQSINVTNNGQNYITEPSVVLSSGDGAAAQAYVSNGRIISIAVISSGAGYTTAPKVLITGEGFGAVGIATIQEEGVDAGKVISITIANRGIGYQTGTTQIRLEPIGQDATFQTEIFKWNYNLQETTLFDYANGSIFEGFNKQFGGEYAHASNPKQLRYVLGDNLNVVNGNIAEKDSGIVHSPIIGWAFDGNPIYGPYGLSDPTNLASTIVQIKSSYVLKSNLIFDSVTNTDPQRIEGPLLTEYPAGIFVEDYEYEFRSEQFFLDEYNGRFCKTPDFPDGTYAYFITLNADGSPAFPYIVGPKYYSTPDTWNLSQFATQSNIPEGIVRFRAPFENVDIDVDRAPNESTNALTLENGDILTFEVEDENLDGVINQEELDDPAQMFEESRLELFDYFPKIDLSSRVDIEVETITKFEDAKISGFVIENAGVNHQVGDRLVFDDTGTEGYGASAVIDKIEGKAISNYTYEYNTALDEYFGIVQTTTPHEMIVGDIVNITTTPLMEPTSKSIVVHTIAGLESVVVDQSGLGYDQDFPVEVTIDSTTGIDAEVEAVVNSTGTLIAANVLNSGRNYLSDPKIRISHPQIQKRATYYAVTESYQGQVIYYDGVSDTTKNTYLVGSIASTNGDIHGLLTKINSDGTKLWSKSLSCTQPALNKRCELLSVIKKDTSVYVIGQTYQQGVSTASFNPDIVVAKYQENESGTLAQIVWQKEIAGISGVLRNDYITSIDFLGNNLIMSGWTTTNATGTSDGILIYMSPDGDVLHKRKITSISGEEKLLSVKVDSEGAIYTIGQGPSNTLIVTKSRIVLNKIVLDWQRQLSEGTKQFSNMTALIDEYDELYITASVTTIFNKIALIKLASDTGEIILQKEYTIQNVQDLTVSTSNIDIFGDINIGYTAFSVGGSKSSGILKLKYTGEVEKSYTISSFTKGISANKIISDVSGDATLIGTAQENQTDFLYNAESAYTDVVGRRSDLVPTGSVTISSNYKWGTSAFNIPVTAIVTATTPLVTSNWTLEGWFQYTSPTTTKSILNAITVADSSNSIIVQINSDVSNADYGKIRADLAGSASVWSTQATVTSLLNSEYTYISVTKSTLNTVSTYKVLVNGVEYVSISSSTIDINPQTITIGSTTTSTSNEMLVDDIRLSTYTIAPTGSAPTSAFIGSDYGNSNGYLMKFDKNADSERMGNIILTNNGITVSRVETTVTTQDTQLANINFALGGDGLQVLDFTEINSQLTQDFHLPSSTFDLWSSRTATIPSPGGRKATFKTSAYGKYFLRHFTVSKFDNVRKFTINQSNNFVLGSTLIQKNTLGAIVGSGRIVSASADGIELFVTDVVGSFSLNTGTLESDPAIINELKEYSFVEVDATTPGTFEMSIPGSVAGTFKTYSDEDYLIRIDEIITGSTFARGSVVTLGASNYSFNTAKTSVTITGLNSVTKITLITNLTKTLTVTAISQSDRLFVRTTASHYLNVGDNIYTETAPAYSYANGSFYVDEIVSKREFIFKIKNIPDTAVGAASLLYVYVKHPTLKFIYGQQYTFDLAHPSNFGYFLSFYRDNLIKIEYTFKNIVRKGRPGLDAPGASPFISFKITDDVENISYYADPSRIGDRSPVSPLSYIDVVKSPYIGSYDITSTFGGTATLGDNRFKFKLPIDPEKNAQANTSSYSTKSSKVAGSIASIRLVNGGGFYKRLPVVSDILSVRKIERVEIRDTGTEYAVGEYFGIPILGNGAGGKVRLSVADGSDPAGQITEVVVTDPGKGYTEAYIDVDAIPGILGSQLAGSGAVLDVIIPPKGTGSSIFVRGENIGKIKKLKNNNFGFNYTHDYTLRPEITFPINLQLTNTSILSSIKVTNPGTGYTSIPEIAITGGGGSGASAEAELRNGRINAIIIKNAGFGYSTPPTIEVKTSFTYVVNLDLGLFQIPYPHGIANGAEVTFSVQDSGQGTQFPLTSFGYLNGSQIYYAISGESAGLETDQLRIALTPGDAASGNFISFANTGTGRQIILTNSFGGAAEAVVETGRFLNGEVVFQGAALETAAAKGFVSDNDGWQIGPRVLKLVDVEGVFTVGQIVTGVISKTSGTINNINAARGVIDVDSTTRTPGRFLDDVGKPNEIVQKVQDSYLYQAFSYNIKSPISIEEWKDSIISNAHATGFKIFGEIGILESKKGFSDRTDFELTKSVNLIESAVTSNIENFAIVEPVYEEFDNTQVIFRTKRLTSSEEILTSYVQRIDSIAYLFDGERTTFPLTIDGSVVIASTSQVALIINGVSQAPGEAYVVNAGSIIFNEPPPAPTKISYAKLTLQFLSSTQIVISNISGILPELGQIVRGLTSNVTATVIESTTNSITIFNNSGLFQEGELIICNATGLDATIDSVTILPNDNIFEFKESITNINKKTAEIEEINLNLQNNISTNQVLISKTSGTYSNPSGLLAISINDFIISAKTRIVAKVIGISPYIDPQTNEPLSSLIISDPSSFFGLLYNRIISEQYPSVLIDDISKSNVEVVDVDDNELKNEANIPEFEVINSTTFEYGLVPGTTTNTFEEDEFIQNIKIKYANFTGDFTSGETIKIQKMAYKNIEGGNYQEGDIITTSGGYTATVIGVNYASKTLFLGAQSGSYSIGDIVRTDKSFVSNADIVDDRFADAYDIILLNKLLIADVAVGRMLDNFPGFSVPGGSQNCKDDIVDFIEEMCFNLKYGGNHKVYDVGLMYINNAYLLDERDESIYAFNEARDMAIQAMRMQTITLGGHTSLVQIKDFTRPGDLIGQELNDTLLGGGIYLPGDCQNVASAITTLFAILTDAIGTDAAPGSLTGIPNTLDRNKDAAELILRNKLLIADVAVGRMLEQYPSFTVPNGNQNCIDDIIIVLEELANNLAFGGNNRVYDAALYYVSGGQVSGEETQSVYAFNEARDMAIQAMRNETITIGGYSTRTQYRDLTITIDPSNPVCANTASAITTLMAIVTGAITSGNLSGVTRSIARTTIGTVEAQIGAYLDIPFVVNKIAPATDTITTYQIFGDSQNRFKDAANLIRINSTYIIDEAAGRMKARYPDLIIPGDEDGSGNGTSRCKVDLALILSEVVKDIEFGGNANSLAAARFYLDENGGLRFIALQVLQSVFAHQQISLLCQDAVVGRLSSTPQYTNEIPINPIGITIDSGACANVRSKIDTLWTLINDVITTTGDVYKDAGDLLWFNRDFIADESVGLTTEYFTYSLNGVPFNAFEYPNGATGVSKCKRDIKDFIIPAVIADLLSGGDSNIIDVIKAYLNSSNILYVKDELLPTIYAMEQANILCQYAVDNWVVTGTNNVYSPTFGNPNDIFISGRTATPTGVDYNPVTGIATFTVPLHGFIAGSSIKLVPNSLTFTCASDGNASTHTYPRSSDPAYNTPLPISNVTTNTFSVDIGPAGITSAHTFVSSTTNSVLYNVITIDDGTYGGHCSRIKSAIDTLFTTAIGILLPEREPKILAGRFNDASNLITANAALIADVAVGRMLDYYPAFTVPNGNQNCKDDIKDLLSAVCFNLRFGGNHKVYDAAGLYISGAHVSGEEVQSVYAFNQAKDIAIQVIRNESVTLGGYTSLTQVKDITITVDTGSPVCADVASAITTLMAIPVQAVLPGDLTGIIRTTDSAANNTYRNAAKLIMFNKVYFQEEVVASIAANYPGFNFGGTETTISSFRTKCKRDIGIIVDSIVYDLLTNGNSAILNSTQYYIDATTGSIISLQGELVQAIFGYTELKSMLKQAIRETLASPSPFASFYRYEDPSIALTAGELTGLDAFLDDKMSILLGTLNNSNYLEVNEIVPFSGLEVPTPNYPTRLDLTGITGKLSEGDYIFGETSQFRGEIESITTNRATIKKVLKRIRVNWDDVLQRFLPTESISKLGVSSINATVYGYSYSENFNYIDVTPGTGVMSIGDILINDDGYRATIVSVTDKIQISDIIGSFADSERVKGFTNGTQADLIDYNLKSASVLSNTGSKLVLDTESYIGNFEVSDVVFSNTSNVFIDVNFTTGTAPGLGNVLQTKSIFKVQVSIPDETTNVFVVGRQLQDSSTLTRVGVITGVVLTNLAGTEADIYLSNIEDGPFEVSSTVLSYEPGNNFPVGIATVNSVITTASEAYGYIEKIVTSGGGNRYFLSGVKGTFNQYAEVLGRGLFKAGITASKPIIGRIKRSFRGFDGTQTTFNLTILNGTPYFPDPEGHLLVFLNGVLQPPTQSYSAFSDVIQFTEPPDLGSSFHSVYVGKLRQLDDISFEFDSLRSSFNLKLDEVFYSLTVTSGSDSGNVKPENNLIISLNGVIQEPGVAFELVGSRIIFAEVPRAGSSFVGFSYIGSEADVIAKSVVPPLESGDELVIEGEDEDRTVAIIESSNSLVTFDYTGSVFGRNAAALTTLITGRISFLSVTSGGDGYTSRPSVSIDSSTGFDAQIKALVGVSRVEVVDPGYGYAYPGIEIQNDVADTPTALLFDSEVTQFDSDQISFDEA
jgi:hypothetical protein